MSFTLAFFALLLDRFGTFPAGIGDKLGHPVIWQGKLIEWLEARLNRGDGSAQSRRFGGVIMLATLIFVTLAASLLVLELISYLPLSWTLEVIMSSIFLAHASLHKAVRGVATGLETSLVAGRNAVAHIVGRDTKNLDEHEISRAAIESLAENSSDGIIAPLFWLAIFGLPGIAVYKAINTADSMVGHKSERYIDFGRASAQLDDLVNIIPARLTALFYAMAAWFMPQKRSVPSWKTAVRDAPNHVSPNAGWPEAALAGALDFGLGGSRAYNGRTLDLAKMGDGRRDLLAADIATALKLSAYMSTVALAVVGLLALTQL